MLRTNTDIFTWSATDMPGIPSEIIIHQLNVNPNIKLVKKKKQPFTPERQKIIDEGVDKLLVTNFIRKTHYPKWLVNVVMVKKANEK